MSRLSSRRRRAGWRFILSTSLVGWVWVFFAVSNVASWSTNHRPVGLGAVGLECVVAVLFITRRQPLTVSRSPIAWIAALLGGFGLNAARPHYAPVGGLELVYQALQVGGAIAATIALITLGRSFGFVAANRGVQTRGPYRIVRHPVYASYLLVEAGYLLENPSVSTALVISAVMVAQLGRVWQEERCLAADPVYAEYRQRVRQRLVPFIV